MSNSESESEIKSKLREWVAQSSNVRVDDDTRIIDNRVVSSLQLLELVMFVEKLRRERVQVDRINAGAFADINTIYTNFFDRASA